MNLDLRRFGTSLLAIAVLSSFGYGVAFGYGGGGGGGGSAYTYGCMDRAATNYNSAANVDNKICLYPQGNGATNKMIALPNAVTEKKNPVVPPGQERKGEVLGASTFAFTRGLGMGSEGVDVTELQKRLTDEGYYSGPITGYFGSLTEAGVKKYQKAKGLEQVGNLGPKTRAMLNDNAGAVLGASVDTSVTDLTPEAKAALVKQILAMILELQKELDALKAAQQ